MLSTSAPVTLAGRAVEDGDRGLEHQGLKGSQTVQALADPANALAESNEADNRRSITVAVK